MGFVHVVASALHAAVTHVLHLRLRVCCARPHRRSSIGTGEYVQYAISSFGPPRGRLACMARMGADLSGLAL